MVVPKTEYRSSGVQGGMLPQKILKSSPWNAISSILGDDYTNSEDCKVRETHDFSWVYACKCKRNEDGKAKHVKLRHFAGFSIYINNLHPIVHLFLTYWLDKMIIRFGSKPRTDSINISTGFINVGRVPHHPKQPTIKCAPDCGKKLHTITNI